MKAFLTGSQVYGRSGPNSDVDLVIYVSKADLITLETLADRPLRELRVAEHRPTDSNPGGPGGEEHRTASLRFGRLNLICVTDPIAYGVWLKGTKRLHDKSVHDEPATRDEAIALFRSLRLRHGVSDCPPPLDKGDVIDLSYLDGGD